YLLTLNLNKIKNNYVLKFMKQYLIVYNIFQNVVSLPLDGHNYELLKFTQSNYPTYKYIIQLISILCQVKIIYKLVIKKCSYETEKKLSFQLDTITIRFRIECKVLKNYLQLPNYFNLQKKECNALIINAWYYNIYTLCRSLYSVALSNMSSCLSSKIHQCHTLSITLWCLSKQSRLLKCIPTAMLRYKTSPSHVLFTGTS
ncbi:hypothetical protein AGLY_003510, partial [Aphis glycines]